MKDYYTMQQSCALHHYLLIFVLWSERFKISHHVSE